MTDLIKLLWRTSALLINVTLVRRFLIVLQILVRCIFRNTPHIFQLLHYRFSQQNYNSTVSIIKPLWKGSWVFVTYPSRMQIGYTSFCAVVCVKFKLIMTWFIDSYRHHQRRMSESLADTPTTQLNDSNDVFNHTKDNTCISTRWWRHSFIGWNCWCQAVDCDKNGCTMPYWYIPNIFSDFVTLGLECTVN